MRLALAFPFFLFLEFLESTQAFVHLENVKALNNTAYAFPREAFELLMKPMLQVLRIIELHKQL